jgi:hypothetical protein
MLQTLSRTAAIVLLALAAVPAARAADDQQLEWKFVTGYPRPMEMAIVSGDPAKEGPYVVRFRAPSGMKWSAHRYPDTREVTIIKGIYWFATGDSYNWRDMNEHKVGDVLTKEAGQSYYGWARTAVVIEEKGMGPSAIEYVHPEEDPRNKRKRRGSGSE